MLPNPLHAASVHRCQSMGSGPCHQQRRSNRCVARLARLARAVNSPSSVGFNLQDNIPACSDRTCSIQMRWLAALGPCTIEVEQCRWWLGQVVHGISRISVLNIHAILPRTKIIERFNQIGLLEQRFEINLWKRPSQKHSEASIMKTPPR
jgi:hypothetical protein